MKASVLLIGSLVVLFSACTHDSIDVGSIDPDAGTPAATTGGTGGTTTDPPATGGAAGTGAGGAGGNTSMPGPCLGSTMRASGASNYNLASSLAFANGTVKPLTELTFDWSEATVDLRRRAMNPATDIAMVTVWMFELNLRGLQTKLNNDSIVASDLTFAPLVYYPDGSKLSAKLSEFTMLNAPVDIATVLPYFDPSQFPAEGHTYAMMVSASRVLGTQTLMVQAFQVENDSANTTVAMVPDSTTMAFAADLRSLTPMPVSVAQPTLLLDWSGMSTNALGLGFTPSSITAAFVGHFVQGLPELEASFPNLDGVASELFRGPVTGPASVALSTLKTSAGNGFAGIDRTGTWLLGLLCEGCHNPSPWYVTVLAPCD